MQKFSQEVQSSGMVETMYSDGDALTVQYEHDAEPAFEMVRKTRQESDVFAAGLKKDFVHAFHIPVGVYMELRGIGIDVYTAPLKEVVAGLHKLHRYDACRLTDKRFA